MSDSRTVIERQAQRAEFHGAMAAAADNARGAERDRYLAEIREALRLVAAHAIADQGRLLILLTAERKRALGRLLSLSETRHLRLLADDVWRAVGPARREG